MKVERRNAECPVLNVSQEGEKQLEDLEIVLRYKAIGPTVLVQNMLHCYRMEETLGNDPPEVCVEDELTNSGKWLLSTFISYVLIRHPSVREIQESFASLKHIVSLELGC